MADEVSLGLEETLTCGAYVRRQNSALVCWASLFCCDDMSGPSYIGSLGEGAAPGWAVRARASQLSISMSKSLRLSVFFVLPLCAYPALHSAAASSGDCQEYE